MHIKQEANVQEIDTRISQLEKRFTMDWYDKDTLLEDLYNLREMIRMLAKKHEKIKSSLNDYNLKIDCLVDQLIQ